MRRKGEVGGKKEGDREDKEGGSRRQKGWR
jgi:hypothetical protein